MKMLAHILSSIAITAALLVPALAQTGKPKPASTLNSEVNQNITDNIAGLDIPSAVRQVLLDIIASGGGGTVAGTPCNATSGLSPYQFFADTTNAPAGTQLSIWDGTTSTCVPWATLNQTNSTFAWNDTTEVIANGAKKWVPLFNSNPGTATVHRFNRIFCGEATSSSSDFLPVTQKDWLETLVPNTTGVAQFVCVDTTGNLGVLGAARTSDTKTALGTTSGGSQGGTFYGLNDDVTPSTTPISCGTCGTAIAKGKSSTVAISNASPAVITWTAHGFVANTAIIFTSTGTLPTGLTAGTTYFVIAAGLATNTFEVSATVGGAAINTSSAGSGTFTGTAATNGLSVNQFDIINAGSLVTPTPFGGVTSGFTGNQFTAGAVTGLPINNVSAALSIGAGVSGCVGGTCRFEKGLIGFNGSLNTANGAGGNGVLVELARGMSIRWLNSTPTTDAEMWGNASGLNVSSAILSGTNGGAGGSFTFNGATSGSCNEAVNATSTVLTLSTCALTVTQSATLGGVTNTAFVITPAPVTTSSTTPTVPFTQPSTIFNPAAGATVTLPSASTVSGEWLYLKLITAQSVVSASSNVVPLAGGAAGTAIFSAATAGKFSVLQSDGTNWQIMEQN